MKKFKKRYLERILGILENYNGDIEKLKMCDQEIKKGQ